MAKNAITTPRAEGMPIGELSRRTGVHIETIRYYEKIGMVPPPPRTEAGRRVYGASEERTLSFIHRARELGFGLDEIRALLALGGPGMATCSDVCTIASRHLTTIRSKIVDLQKLENYLAQTMSQCSGAAVPDCAVLDALYPPHAGDTTLTASP
jgi:MerR family mercuric resistance operon transcriptional regulator